MHLGGKSIGRLLWLDCFEDITITSVFHDSAGLKRRSFRFVLDLEDQIKDYITESVAPEQTTSFHVHFKDLRSNGYFNHFPGRGNFVFQHITSHFLPTFIGGSCPKVTIHVGDEIREYPKAIDEIVYRREPKISIDTDQYGILTLTLMECNKVASADLNGSHFVHFIAHDRTVHSQSIDGKLGLKFFGDNGDLVFHAILTGDFLNINVNQERTAFQFEDAVIDQIINDVCWRHIGRFLEEPLSKLKGEQKQKIIEITATYPSVAFGDTDELQAKVPSGELKEDAIYGHLSRERYRREGLSLWFRHCPHLVTNGPLEPVFSPPPTRC